MLSASLDDPNPTAHLSDNHATTIPNTQHGIPHNTTRGRAAESFDLTLGEDGNSGGSGSEWSISPGQSPSSSNDGWLSPLERNGTQTHETPAIKRLSITITQDALGNTRSSPKKRRNPNTSPFQDCPEGVHQRHITVNAPTLIYPRNGLSNPHPSACW